MIAAAPAVISAIENALEPFGVHIAQVPLPPPKLLELIAQARAALVRRCAFVLDAQREAIVAVRESQQRDPALVVGHHFARSCESAPRASGSELACCFFDSSKLRSRNVREPARPPRRRAPASSRCRT